jgi:hypothetical protein
MGPVQAFFFLSRYQTATAAATTRTGSPAMRFFARAKTPGRGMIRVHTPAGTTRKMTGAIAAVRESRKTSGTTYFRNFLLVREREE